MEAQQYTLSLGEKLRKEFGGKSALHIGLVEFLDGFKDVRIVEGSTSDRRVNFEAPGVVVSQVMRAAEANGFIVSPNVKLDESFDAVPPPRFEF